MSTDHENTLYDEILQLASRSRDGLLSREESRRLETLVVENNEAREYYLFCSMLTASLSWANRCVRDDGSVVASLPATDDGRSAPSPTAPSFPMARAPSYFGFVGQMARTAAGYLPEGMPLAYLIATVIFSIASNHCRLGSRVATCKDRCPTIHSPGGSPISNPLSPIPC